MLDIKNSRSPIFLDPLVTDLNCLEALIIVLRFLHLIGFANYFSNNKTITDSTTDECSECKNDTTKTSKHTKNVDVTSDLSTMFLPSI